MAEFSALGAFVKIGTATVDGAYKYSLTENMETHDVSDFADIGSGRTFVQSFIDWSGAFNIRLQDNKALPVVSSSGAVSFACGVSGKLTRSGSIFITGVAEDLEIAGEVTVTFKGSGALARAVTVS